MVSAVKSVCSSFADAFSVSKKAKFFAYYADGSEINGLDVWFIMIGDNSISIQGEDHFMCTIQFSKIENAEYETMPDNTVELRMYLTDGTEIAIDTCS